MPVEPAPAAPPRELTTSLRQLSPSSPNILQPARPTAFNFRFSADWSFKEKFERLVEVMGVENAQKHLAEILEQALDVALDKKDPKRKLERRIDRSVRRSGVACLPGAFDYDAPMPTLTQLLERGKDNAIALGAPGRAPLAYAELRRHVAETVESLNRLGIGATTRLPSCFPTAPR